MFFKDCEGEIYNLTLYVNFIENSLNIFKCSIYVIE